MIQICSCIHRVILREDLVLAILPEQLVEDIDGYVTILFNLFTETMHVYLLPIIREALLDV